MIARIQRCNTCGKRLANPMAYYCRPCATVAMSSNEERRKKTGARRAIARVAAAIRSGKLPRITAKTKCTDCGDKATEYEHRDYSKPLEVEPVCHRCNILRGPAKPIEATS